MKSAAKISIAILSIFSLNVVKSSLTGNVDPDTSKMINMLLENSNNTNDTSVWDSLAEMTDLYGHRMTGHVQYDRSVQWVMNDAKNYPEFVAKAEPVTVNVWARNSESLELYIPTRYPPVMDLPMLGLGQSIGTGPGGITAEVIPVQTFEDLEKLGSENIAGKIVLFCKDFVSYGDNVKYRSSGALKAQEYGAVGVLVQSITGYSLVTPHTGVMNPADIPAAAISVEDSKLIQRMYQRNLKAQADPSIPNAKEFAKPLVKLTMNAQNYEGAKVSDNIVIDLKGSEKPEEIVIISGHFDSWDVGVGAMDDGGGAFSSYGALKMLAKLPKKPKRTIRVVMWNNEETLSKGADGYMVAHKDEIKNHIFAIESDIGNFNPWGLKVKASDDIVSKMEALGKMYLTSIGGGNITQVDNAPAVDVTNLCDIGVPCASFETLDKYTDISPLTPAGYEGYFRFHHTEADRMEILDKHVLRKNSVALAVWSLIIANQ
ncbi:Carboxypeptidase Q [Smittium culicis]|uniref:Peptide hydrolase n=2 Tax=Smittium culicis TaxID=133412 RepID=A0A1R1XFQ2_9FUNG|nr:Carboxypeptidase Q [Smittium culicis]OMJ13467.1 Carboxypeptidase Q [Smittium culicis]